MVNPAWCAILPLRPYERAKTRLEIADSGLKVRLARAFAADTLAAIRACPLVGAVVVVGADVNVVGAGPTLTRVADPGELNSAVLAGQQTALSLGFHRLAVVAGDLPCLTASDVTLALNAAPMVGRAFIADLSGQGTTMLFASSAPLLPAFGEGSACAHRRGGAVALTASDGARCDVDTSADLERATSIGLGPASTKLLGMSPPLG